ncbi:hypothetical protein BH23ACT11_BH23ACT11_00240 [soil metagenome]
MTDHTLDQQEVEWQFDAFDLRPIRRWLETGLGETEPRAVVGRIREISDTYLDSDDWRIYRAGYAMRVRRIKGKRPAEATLKSLNTGDEDSGLRRRREISQVLDGATLEALDDASGPVGGPISALIGQKSLRVLFEVETRRTTYALTFDGSEVGEVALDETAIPLDNGVEPTRLRRVEVEVDSDAVSRLEPFVEHLRRECRLYPAVASKYESGLLARKIVLPQPPEFGPTSVSGDPTTAELAFRVLREQFSIFLAHEPGTRIGEDPEELHDMRVATRRMRAAMKIFENAVPVRTQKFRADFKWVAVALGNVRDLDVQLECLDAWVSGADPQEREALEALRSALEGQRMNQRTPMLRTLNSRRYARLVESFGEFLRRGPTRRAQAARRPIRADAPDLVRGPYRKVRKLGDSLRQESSSEDYHELCKRAKRLRYALESVSEIYGEPAKDLIKSLKNVQDLLGDHQDAVVASAQVRYLRDASKSIRGLPPETMIALESIAERYEAHALELRTEFPVVFDRIKGKRWNNLRNVMKKARSRDASGKI